MPLLEDLDIDLVKEKLTEVLDIMWKRCEVKLRFSDFSTITRSSTLAHFFSQEEMLTCMMNLLPDQEIKERGVRLLGGTMSNFQVESLRSSPQMKIEFESDNHSG